SKCSAGEEVKACLGWQKHLRVSLSEEYLRREFFVFPPIVRKRERAAVHCKIQVGETVPGENPAIAQPCAYFWAAHRFQENFAGVQVERGDAGCCRHDDGVFDRTGSIRKCPLRLGRKLGGD